MGFETVINELNWWAIVVAALSSFVVGFFWYDKKTFGQKWMKLVGISEKQMNSTDGMATTFTMTGIASLLTAFTLAYLMNITAIEGALNGLVFGAIIGFVFRASAHVIHNGFAQRDKTLTLIDGAHDVVAIALMGLIIGIWR